MDLNNTPFKSYWTSSVFYSFLQIKCAFYLCTYEVSFTWGP